MESSTEPVVSTDDAEWIPKRDEIQRLMNMVKITYTLQTLEQRQVHTGPHTFQEGLYLVLLHACQLGSFDVVEYFLKNLSNLFDVNDIFTYGFKVVYERPVPYVTIFKDVITFRDDSGSEMKSSTLLEIAQKYKQSEIVKLLMNYGAK